MIILIDSYSESNVDSYLGVGPFWKSTGQSFTNTNADILDSCKFYLKAYNSPTGNAHAELYAHSGTYGISSLPTGSALATSDNFDVSILTSSPQLVTFNFSGVNRINLSPSTHYVIVFYFSNSDGGNYINCGRDQTSPTASGNGSEYNNSEGWAIDSADFSFYVYGETYITGPFPTHFNP